MPPRRLIAGRVLVCLLLFVSALLCQAGNLVALTDKTFDSVHDAFGHRPMLILAQRGSDNNHVAVKSFQQLLDDKILRENGIMLVTIDVEPNRMLRARLNIDHSFDLPSILYLYNDRIFRYQGDLSSSNYLRSYALKGFENNMPGEQFAKASLTLYISSICAGILYNNNTGRLNLFAVVLLSMVVGVLMAFVLVMLVIAFGNEDNGKKKMA